VPSRPNNETPNTTRPNAVENPRVTLVTDKAEARIIAAARAKVTANANTRFNAIAKAIEAGDAVEAKLQLSLLEDELPAGSLTLMRAQAWVQSVGIDRHAARAAYTAILSRLPDDENALLNLANLEMKDGNLDAAGTLLAHALRTSPDSVAARDAQQRLVHATESARTNLK
jgi:predicted Zn-dependent protease